MNHILRIYVNVYAQMLRNITHILRNHILRTNVRML